MKRTEQTKSNRMFVPYHRAQVVACRSCGWSTVRELLVSRHMFEIDEAEGQSITHKVCA